MSTYHKIDEIFTKKGIQLKCVKSTSNCYSPEYDKYCHFSVGHGPCINCCHENRKDGQFVCFITVTNKDN